MFIEGQLLYFRPFYFKNGAVPANKFFIILRNLDNTTIVASLPTKVNNAPNLINVVHGCINDDQRMFNCYAFEQGKIICDNGFSFNLPTYIYGNQVNDYELDVLTKGKTIKEGIDYDLIGMLTKDEYAKIYKCLSNNNSTKGRIKRLLSAPLK